MKKITYVILGTNSYLPLAIRLVKKIWYFKNIEVNFKLVYNIEDPTIFFSHELNSTIDFIFEDHKDWVTACHRKYQHVKNTDSDFVFYLDADTNLKKPFDSSIMYGGVIGAEHFGNRSWMKDKKNYDRNIKSAAYIPLNTPLPQMYYQGAFFGGIKEKVNKLCDFVIESKRQDSLINYEPGVNDESYLNKYFHYNPPTTITLENFPFSISDKGGINNMRFVNNNWESIRKDLILNREYPVEVANGRCSRISPEVGK